jgi:hypothetical protein
MASLSSTFAPRRIRVFALIAGAALLVHQLRYLIEFRGRAGQALAEQGHGYLSLLAPLVVLAVLAGAVLFGFELHKARRGAVVERTPRPRSFLMRWLVLGCVQTAIYVGQELAEGLLAGGHPPGLTGIFGEGGWIAIPLAFAVAALVAFLLRAADVAVIRATRRTRASWPSLDVAVQRSPVASISPLDVVARNLAGRGPPLTA